jgi:hypothetical protein
MRWNFRLQDLAGSKKGRWPQYQRAARKKASHDRIRMRVEAFLMGTYLKV